jgi:hypothetical protein
MDYLRAVAHCFRSQRPVSASQQTPRAPAVHRRAHPRCCWVCRVAVIFRAIETWGKIKNRQKNSPFRYLTTLERNGVIFALSK